MGHVDDADAASTDCDALLTQMKEDTAAENPDSRNQGFATVTLLGRAAPPHCDAASRQLYWAKLMPFRDSSDNTLNCNIRALGRDGVLQLNFIAGESALPAVEAAAPEVLKMVTFTDGNRYGDFKPGVDTVAAVGIGGPIAGNGAAKTGISAALELFLKQGFIVVLIAPGAGWRKLKSLFTGRKPAPVPPTNTATSDTQAPTLETPPPPPPPS